MEKTAIIFYKIVPKKSYSPNGEFSTITNVREERKNAFIEYVGNVNYKKNMVLLYLKTLNKDSRVIDLVTSAVAESTGVPESRMFLRTRVKEIVVARQLVHYYMLLYTKLSLFKIGKITGGYDHATVGHSRNTVNNMVETKDVYYYQPFIEVGEKLRRLKKPTNK